jgi:nicotinamidase-related amidase
MIASMPRARIRESLVSPASANHRDQVRTARLIVADSHVMTSEPIRDPLAEFLRDDPPIDRTTVNSWEDIEFVQAVRASGRRKLIFCALWTEVCMAFTALDALRDGYEVYPVVDAIGGTSPEAHRAGLERVIQAGGQPISWVSLACELQRDWARVETVPAIVEIVLTDRLLKEAAATGELTAASR